MALVNAVLVLWAGGTLWVEDGASIAEWDRREGFLSAGQASSPEEAFRLGQALLARSAQPQLAIAASLEPVGGDVPYVDFTIGDVLTVPDDTGAMVERQLVALTVTEDEDGNPFYATELGDLHSEQEQRLQRWMNRMAHGSLSGTTELSSPLPQRPPQALPGRERRLDAFSWNGSPPLSAESHQQRPLQAVRIVGVEVTITGTTTGHTWGNLRLYSGGGFSDVLLFDFPAASAGGRITIDPSFAMLLNGPGGDTVSLYLGAAPAATGVTVVPILA